MSTLEVREQLARAPGLVALPGLKTECGDVTVEPRG
jgi:hypothetical protein